MPDPRPALAGYAFLMVALYVAEPSHIELTVHDTVRIDRLADINAGRPGHLVPPGTSSVPLAEGTYVFRTTGDAQVRLADANAVQVTAVIRVNDKDQWPDPPERFGVLPASQGDAPLDRVPTLTLQA